MVHTRTYLIVPAETDIAGQCRIVMHLQKQTSPLAHYRECPDEWRDVGLISSKGRVRCLACPHDVWLDMRDCEPMHAGMYFYNEEGE